MQGTDSFYYTSLMNPNIIFSSSEETANSPGLVAFPVVIIDLPVYKIFMSVAYQRVERNFNKSSNTPRTASLRAIRTFSGCIAREIEHDNGVVSNINLTVKMCHSFPGLKFHLLRQDKHCGMTMEFLLLI